MFERIYKHSAYYAFLILVLVLGFLLAFSNSSNRGLQIEVITFTTFFYVLWGILHHLLNHDLNAKIVIEYILIGSFGLTIIFFLLNTI